MPANGRQSASSLLRVRSAPSVHRFRLLRYGPDRGELIGGQRLLGKQQAAAFIEVGAPCAQDGSRLLEGLRDYVAHRHVDLALGRLGGFDAAGRSPQERLRRRCVGARPPPLLPPPPAAHPPPPPRPLPPP